MQSIIIIFLGECDKEENLAVTVAAILPVQKYILKCFVQCQEFAQSPPGRLPGDKHSVNISQHFRFV
jgi:hypothetical protein